VHRIMMVVCLPAPAMVSCANNKVIRAPYHNICLPKHSFSFGYEFMFWLQKRQARIFCQGCKTHKLSLSPSPSLQIESCWINNRSVHVCILQAVKSCIHGACTSSIPRWCILLLFFTISQRMISLSPAGRVLFFNNEIEALQRKERNP